MAKNLVLGPILAALAQIWCTTFFSWMLFLLDVRHCCKLSWYVTSRKTKKLNLRKWQKNIVLGLILAPLTQIWPSKMFIVDFTSTRCLTLL